MKKLSLILALLLCLMPVLTACGGGGAEKTVKQYLKAVYKDFDSSVLEEITLEYNKKLNKDILSTEEFEQYANAYYYGDDSEYYDWDAEKQFDAAIDSLEDRLGDNKRVTEKDWEKYKVNYKVEYCEVYEEDDDLFDFYKEYSFSTKYTKTDFKKKITAYARAYVSGTISYVDEDMKFVQPINETFVLFCIDDEWYISDVYVSAYETVEDTRDAIEEIKKLK